MDISEQSKQKATEILSGINAEYEKLPPEEQLEVLDELNAFLDEVIAKKQEFLNSTQTPSID